MRRMLVGLCFSMMSFQGLGADINSILVFVTKAQSERVTHCDVNCQLYELDATENTLEAFFGELPDNEEEAYAWVMEKINTPEWKAYERQVIESQKTVIKAFELGVKKYPAIVINETYVSYGTTDIAKALADYEELLSDENN